MDLVAYFGAVLVVFLMVTFLQGYRARQLDDQLGADAGTAVDEGTQKAAQQRMSAISGGIEKAAATAAAAADEIDREEASEKVEQTIKAMPREQQAVLTQYTSGDGAGAAEMERMLAKDPNNLQLLDWLAFMYYSNNETEKAIETYSRIIQLDASNPGQHYYLGNSFYKASRIDEALVHWKKVVELKPEGKYAKKALERIKKVEAALSS